MASIVFLPVLFLVATFGLYYLAISAPLLESGESLNLHFPKSFEDLKNITTELSVYKEQHPLYVLALFCASFLYKQSFGIPGSAGLTMQTVSAGLSSIRCSSRFLSSDLLLVFALFNISSGALFGFWLGFPLSCVLTAIGATNCYILSYLFGHRWINRFFPEKLAWFRSVIHANRANLTYYLLFLRLFPMSPNWFLNIASPHIGIPIHQFFFTVLFGLMPYNFVCVQGGSVLRELNSFNDIFTWGRMFQLLLIACVALIPGIYLKRSSRRPVVEGGAPEPLH